MYERILLATDGTVASTNAETHAIETAAEHGATLHALYVVDESVYSAYSGDEYVDEAEGPEHGLEEHGQETLRRIEAQADEAGVTVVDALEHGMPHEVIVDYATEEDVDLVVLGTKRRPDEYRSLLGSVTDRVLRLTDRPALVIKTDVEE
ncbi:Nucleotide-binding universal stress protein, UspA family [Halogranum amylolyticum]|uniref:Nucleotide-binding universal stress protein, UspA family n=1 Tax=Halogranum amylolyticum TaxID=660520 RepID=A0A1H8URD5_9EURY|nr:universal stress protein [Halogranum amylolyticum]SEP05765.1 Nucleotide-binding universal stress protein, UspA family [Halogranum amylolyticum]